MRTLVLRRMAEVLPVSAHRQRGRADRSAKVEREDLRILVAAELHRHQCQQHRFAGTGRSDDQHVADIADMEREAKRRRTFSAREEQRRGIKMLIACRPRPDGRERDHMREIERRDRRLADIGVDMAGQAPEPGLDRVHAFGNHREVATLNDLLDQPELLGGDTRIGVPDADGRRHIGLADDVTTEFLQGEISVRRLVGSVAVYQHRRLVGHHFLEDRGDRLALREPLAADAGKELGRIGLVERDRACDPAIRKG